MQSSKESIGKTFMFHWSAPFDSCLYGESFSVQLMELHLFLLWSPSWTGTKQNH